MRRDFNINIGKNAKTWQAQQKNHPQADDFYDATLKNNRQCNSPRNLANST